MFNAEKFLPEAIDSILNQTYKNLEILLVDDGSTDNSGIICDNYAEKDTRVRVFHTQNRGVSRARNLGLEQSSGKYIAFVDSDDIVHPRYIEAMLELSRKSHMLMVKCRWVRDDNCDSKIFLATDFDSANHCETIVTMREYRYQGQFSQSQCFCVLYSRELIQDIRFDMTLKYGEDTVFFAEALKKAQRFAYLDEVLYWYRRNPYSAMEVFSKRRYDEILARRRVVDIFQNESKDFVRECNAALALRSMAVFIDAIRAGCSDRAFLQKIWEESFRIRESCFTSRTVGKKKKIKYAIYIYAPVLTEIIIRKRMTRK